MFCFSMILRPPRSTRTETHFPYTTLFRSPCEIGRLGPGEKKADLLPQAKPLRKGAARQQALRQGLLAGHHLGGRPAGGAGPDAAAEPPDEQFHAGAEGLRIAALAPLLGEAMQARHVEPRQRRPQFDHLAVKPQAALGGDRKSTRLNSSH